MDEYYNYGDKIDEYSILKMIGQGRYGIAYLAEDNKGKKFVVKQLKKEMLEKTRKKLFYEREILDKLDNSPYFPKFISTFKDKDREGYILEYIEGQVFYNIVARRGYRFNREEIYTIAGQLIDLVEILHNKNIVHRDIRLPNVIVKDDGSLVLIDFGLARFMNNDRYIKEMDYWFIGDFLIHLYYTTYISDSSEDRPWYEELDLTLDENIFLKKLMGIEDNYINLEEIKEQLKKIKSTN